MQARDCGFYFCPTVPASLSRELEKDNYRLLATCREAALQMERVCEDQLAPEARDPFTNALIGLRRVIAKAEGKS